MQAQTQRRSNGELAERVRTILANRDLTLYQVSERSVALYGRSSPHYLPHNLYYDLRHAGFSPSLFQLFALSRISGYRLDDWANIGNGSGWRFGMVGAIRTVCPQGLLYVRKSDIG